jgi:hypothetical protein
VEPRYRIRIKYNPERNEEGDPVADKNKRIKAHVIYSECTKEIIEDPTGQVNNISSMYEDVGLKRESVKKTN